jgi:transcriptional regulator with XRE-family HTH domain
MPLSRGRRQAATPPNGTQDRGRRTNPPPDLPSEEAATSDPSDPILSRFGITLRRLREDAKLSRQALAERIGSTTKQLEHWETGETNPDLRFLVAIARQFEVSVDGLLADPMEGGRTTGRIPLEGLFGTRDRIEINVYSSPVGVVAQIVHFHKSPDPADEAKRSKPGSEQA